MLWKKLEYLLFHSFNQKKQDDTSSVEDQVFVHSNLRFLSRNSLQYHQEEIKIWDIAQDEFGWLDKNEILKVVNLSLDEPGLEVVIFNDDNHEGRRIT